MPEALAAFTAAPAVAVPEREPQTITWHSFDLRTGRRGMALTTAGQGTVARVLGQAADSSVVVRCYDTDRATAVVGWDAATLPGRTMLVALDQDEAVVWGGMVLTRTSDDLGPWVTCATKTLEHYFDRRYAGDLTFTDTDQASICEGIVDGIAVDGIGFTVDAPASGTRRDYDAFDDEDKTAASLLAELSGLDGGPEWTVDLEWTDSTHTALARIFRVRNRIGTSAQYPTRWEMPGCVVGGSYTEDYGSDNGANDVMATSSGEGDTRPVSEHKVASDLISAGWARFERRFSPATSTDALDALNDYASAELADVRDGVTTLTLEANLDQAPRLGGDWRLGDDITAVLTCPRFPEQMGPDGGLVPGYEQTVRVVGWSADFDARTLTPTTVEVGAHA